MCEVNFEKATGLGRKVNRMSIYVKATVQRFLKKKGVMRNFVEFTRKHLYQTLFFDKVKFLDLQFHLKRVFSAYTFWLKF